MKVLIIFYSMYGHVYRMAEAVAEGAREFPGAQVELYQVPELVPDELLAKSGAKKAREAFAHIPVAEVDRMPEADAIVSVGSEDEIVPMPLVGRVIGDEVLLDGTPASGPFDLKMYYHYCGTNQLGANVLVGRAF